MQLANCVERFYTILNFSIFIWGSALIIVAGHICTNIKDVPEKIQSATFILSVGAIIIGCDTLVAFFDRSETIRSYRRIIITEGILFSAMIIVQAYVGIHVFIKIKDLDKESFNGIVTKEFDEYRVSDICETIGNYIQTNFECCGIDSANNFSSLHLNINGTIPKTYCELNNEYETEACPAEKNFQNGCSQRLFDFLRRTFLTLIGFIGFQLLCVTICVFTIQLAWNYDEKQKSIEDLKQNLTEPQKK